MRAVFIFLFCLLTLMVKGQAVENMASFRIINSDRYIRLHYENDYFTAKDYYYTQGINLESVNPSYRKFPLSKLLLKPASNIHQYGISIEHNGYTPTSIESNVILYGDRPFAAALMLKTFSMHGDSLRHLRITSAFTAGVIGPAAGGYEMQKSIHAWIHGTEPLGWQYQIQNALVLNYEASMEKNLVSVDNKLLMNVMAGARAGSLNAKLSSGLTMIYGRPNPKIVSIFGRPGNKTDQVRRVYFHIYMQPLINIVGYDATMQGGWLFSHASPYTLTASQVDHLTFQMNYGAVLSYRSLNLEYFQTYLTKEFDTGMDHRWGGIRIGVAF